MSSTRDSSPVDIDAFEAAKENVVPLASGRSAKALTGLFSKDRKSVDTALAQGHADFQNEIAAINQDTDDPLDVYHRYIRWTLSSYPSGPSHASQLVPLIERTTRQFVKERRYATDIRYLKLWILYARYVDTPREIYRFLEANDIGTTAAAFYEEWATLEENTRHFKEADYIFSLGVARKAEPLSRLQKRRDAFLARMMSMPPEDREPAPTNRSNTILSQTAQPLRTNTAKNNGASFAVFSDGFGGSENAGGGTWDDFGTRDSRRRENHMDATAWKGEKLPMQPQTNQSVYVEKLEVFRDDTAASSTASDSNGFSLGSKSIRAPSEAEALRTNPFKHYQASDLSFADISDLKPIDTKPTKIKSKAKTKTTPLAAAQTTASERKERVASPLEEIYPDDNPTTNLKYIENSFEEIFAMRRGLYARDGSLQEAIWRAHDQMEWLSEVRKSGEPFIVDASGSAILYHPVTNEPLLGYLKQRKIEAARLASEEAERKADATRRQMLDQERIVRETEASRLSLQRAVPSSPTVNTKAALAEVNDMFGSTQAYDHSLYGIDSRSNAIDSDGETTAASIEVEDFFPPPSQPSQKDSQAGDFVENSFWGALASQQSQASQPALSQPSPQHSYIDESTPSPVRRNRSPVRTGFAVFADENQSQGELRLRKKPLEASRFAPLVDLMTPIVERTNEYTACSRGRTSRLTGDLKDVPLLVDEEEESGKASRRKVSNASSLRSVGEEEEDEDSMNNLLNELRITQETAAKDSETTSDSVRPHTAESHKRQIGDSLHQLVSQGYHDLTQHRANKFESLKRQAKTRTRRSGSGQGDDESGLLLELGADAYSIREKLGEGGFAAVFRIARTDWEEDETDRPGVFALKVQKPAFPYEFWVLHQLRESLQGDARTLQSIIQAYGLYSFSDESHLVLEVCDQGTLLQAVNGSSAAGIAAFGQSTGLDELLAVFFVVELLRTVEAVHQRGFLHGDIRIENCLVRLDDVSGGAKAWSSKYCPSGDKGWSCKGIKLIDFGRTLNIASWRAQDESLTFLADWQGDNRDCPEIRNGEAWSYQPDYYGVAGIAWTLLFGSHFEAGHTKRNSSRTGSTLVEKPFRRYHQTGMWTKLFALLLDPLSVQQQLPITKNLAIVRHEMESWLEENCDKGGRSLKALLKKLEIAQLSKPR